MDRIVVFRKDAHLSYTKGGGNNARKVSEWMDEVNGILRFPRPSLLDFFAPAPGGSAFSKLPTVSESVIRRIKAEAKNGNLSPDMAAIVKKCGWVLPDSEIGRTDRIDQGTAESIRLQVKKQFAERGIDHGLTVASATGDDIGMVAI